LKNVVFPVKMGCASGGGGGGFAVFVRDLYRSLVTGGAGVTTWGWVVRRVIRP
jgi:hypothetical protein